MRPSVPTSPPKDVANPDDSFSSPQTDLDSSFSSVESPLLKKPRMLRGLSALSDIIPETPSHPTGHGSGSHLHSGESGVSSASGFANIESEKKDSRFSLGQFLLRDRSLEFARKRFSPEPKSVTRNLVFIAETVVEECGKQVFNLPLILNRCLQEYIEALSPDLEDWKTYPLVGEFFQELRGKMNLIIQDYLAVTNGVMAIKADIDAGQIPSKSEDGTIEIERILLQRILDESEKCIALLNGEILATMENAERQKKIRSGEASAAQSALTAAEVKLEKKIKLANEAKDGAEGEAKAKGEEVDSYASDRDSIRQKAVKLQDLQKLSAQYNLISRHFTSHKFIGGVDLKTPPGIDRVAPTNNYEFFSYRINSSGSLIGIDIIIDNKRRPFVTKADGTETQTQGDHVTAYGLLSQLFMTSVPLIGRYEDLPSRLAQMLSLSFSGRDKELFEERVRFVNEAKVTSDETRRGFLQQCGGDTYLRSDTLRNFLKVYQAEYACNQVCKIGDEYLNAINKQKGATVQFGKDEKESGSTEKKKGAAKPEDGRGKNEGVKLQELDIIINYILSENLLDLVSKDLSNLGSKEGAVSEIVRQQRIANLTNLQNKLKSVVEKNKLAISGKGSKVQMSIFDDRKQLCGRLGQLMSLLIDLPSFEKLKKSDGIEAGDYKVFLKMAIERHFRICGVTLSSALNKVEELSKTAVDGSSEDVFAILINSFFTQLRKALIEEAKESAVPKVLDEKVGTDLLTILKEIESDIVKNGNIAGVISVEPGAAIKPDMIFAKFLNGILAERVENFRTSYLTLGRVATTFTHSPLQGGVDESAALGSLLSPVKLGHPISTLAADVARPDLDLFNMVGGESNLTHHNVLSLLRMAFIQKGMSEDIYDKSNGTISVAVIGNEDLDRSLRDAIVNFLGQEGRPDRASFALCRGHIGDDGEIVGDTHWTALHLRRITNEDGAQLIQVQYMDSYEGPVPQAIERVLQSIGENGIGDFPRGNGVVADGAIAQLADVTLLPCRVLPCARQRDLYSCAYHTVFNLITMHYEDNFEEYEKSFSGRREEFKKMAAEFIDFHKELLKQEFNGALEVYEAESKSESYSSLPIIIEIVKIIISDDGNIKKLQTLSEIEVRLTKEGDAILVSSLKFEELYRKLVADCVEEIRYKVHDSIADVSGAVDIDYLETYLYYLTGPELCQNPRPLIEVLSGIDKDFPSFLVNLRANKLLDNYSIPLAEEEVADVNPKSLLSLSGVPSKSVAHSGLLAGKDDITFLLIGKGIEQEMARVVNISQLIKDGKVDRVFIFDSKKPQEDVFQEIREEARMEEYKDSIHIIAYCHGNEGKILLGAEVFPESLFELLPKVYGNYVVSVVSCGAGNMARNIKEKLYDHELIINYAGKRATISSADTRRVLGIIDSKRFVPSIVAVKGHNSIELMPPETIKIISRVGEVKFSPFEVFSTGVVTRADVVRRVIEQQIRLVKLFTSAEELGESEELRSLHSLLSYDIGDLTAQNVKEIDQYLLDLAFMVVVTKSDTKVSYLTALVDQLGVDINKVRESRGERLSLITEACAAGNVEMVRFLVARDRRQLTKATENGITPLMAACSRSGNKDVIYDLLSNLSPEEIAREAMVGKESKSALGLACQSGYDTGVIMHILAKGNINHNMWADGNKNNILHHAARGGDIDTFVDLWSMLDVRNLFVRNTYDRTPIDEAAVAGHLRIVQFGLAQGIKLNPRLPLSSTMLAEAVEEGLYDLANYLVENGKGFDNRNTKILHFLAETAGAGDADRLKIATKLLAAGKCSGTINKPDDQGRTAIDIALQYRNDDMVKLFSQYQGLPSSAIAATSGVVLVERGTEISPPTTVPQFAGGEVVAGDHANLPGTTPPSSL